MKYLTYLMLSFIGITMCACSLFEGKSTDSTEDTVVVDTIATDTVANDTLKEIALTPSTFDTVKE